MGRFESEEESDFNKVSPDSVWLRREQILGLKEKQGRSGCRLLLIVGEDEVEQNGGLGKVVGFWMHVLKKGN